MRFKTVFPLVVVLLFSSCQKEYFDMSDDDRSGEAGLLDIAGLEKGWVRIKFAEEPFNISFDIPTRGTMESGLSQLDELAASLGASSIKRVFSDGGKFSSRRRAAGLHLWYDVYFDEAVPVTRAVNGFSELPVIETVEPLAKISRGMTTPETGPVYGYSSTRVATRSSSGEMPFDDPRLPEQWHYDNRGLLEDSRAGADIGLFAAWEENQGDPRVIVAVIDGAIQYDHPDLAANMWTNDNPENGLHGWNFVRDRAQLDPDMHGSHVAGTIAAVNHNGIGVAGIAGGNGSEPGVRLMSCQIFDDWSSGNFAEAIVYAADNGAVIAQNSWGYDVAGYFPRSDRAAIDYFIENAGMDEYGNQSGPLKGGIVIFAAGNDNRSAEYYPGAYDKVVTVGAIAPDYLRAPYSNYGSWVNICAPGGSNSYRGKYGQDHMVLSTGTSGDYVFLEGTSMACPHVSGVAALIVSHYGAGKSGLNAEAVKTILYNSCTDIYGYNSGEEGNMGYGLVNAARALSYNSQGNSPSVDDLEVEFQIGAATLSWTVKNDPAGLPLAEYRIFYGEGSLDNINGEIPPSAASAVVYNSEPAGAAKELLLDDLKIGTAYFFAIIAVDAFGNESEASFIEGDSPGAQGPVRTADIADMYFPGKGDHYSRKLLLSDFFYDPYSHPLGYKLYVSNGMITARIEGDYLEITPDEYGITKVILTVDNGIKTLEQTFYTAVREGSQGIDLYPNPVVDKLTVRVGTDIDGQCRILLCNSSGRAVYERNMEITPFMPAVMDLSGIAAGTYTLIIEHGGARTKGSIIKS